MSAERSLHLAVALDGAGWHPGAWRTTAALAGGLFDPRYWTDLAREAEGGLLDLVTFEDRFAPTGQGDGDRDDVVVGALDAALVASRVATHTERIGLVPTVLAQHTEPFHVSTSIATLDYVSSGRAGVRFRGSWDPREYENVGRRTVPSAQRPNGEQLNALFAEVADHIEVSRRLWDSWEDDAEIRDVSTGRFIDRDRLHYIDFEGAEYSVRGPSITPRPPQGQPPVVVLAHQEDGYRLAGRSADVALVTPSDGADARRIAGLVRAEAVAAGRGEREVRVLADLVVLLDASTSEAEDRRSRLDRLAGREFDSDATIFTGTPENLAELVLDWTEHGVDGFRLRPAVHDHDLRQITRTLVPQLQNAGAFRRDYRATTLRGHLGLDRPDSRYAAA